MCWSSAALCAVLEIAAPRRRRPRATSLSLTGSQSQPSSSIGGHRQPLAQLDTQLYSLRRQKLDELIGNRLIAAEAKKQGVSPTQLLDAEVEAHVRITQAEVTAEPGRREQGAVDRHSGRVT